jgi:electron transport complex protein RnfG
VFPVLSNVKLFFRESWLLVACAFFFGLLLAVTDAAWAPKIAQNKADKTNAQLRTIFAAGEDFEKLPDKVDILSGKVKTGESTIYKISAQGRVIGWAFTAEGFGFADKIQLIVGVDAAFEKMTGFAVVSSYETPGFGDKIKGEYFRNQFVGAPATNVNLVKGGNSAAIDSDIVAITGATVSSTAVVNIINRHIGVIRDAMLSKGVISGGK